jgi:hypothetical protein
MAMNLERVKKEGYSIEAQERSQRLSVVLTGTFDMTASQDLQKFLDEVRAEVIATNPHEVEIDVSSVYYLGSSCIKAFVSLTAALKAAPKHPIMRVVTSSRLDWQERTFAVLARLAPEIVQVERTT